MKLNHEQHGKGREVESASSLQRSRRSLARARSQLTQAVGDVLSGALEGRRSGGGWLTAFGGLAPSAAPQTAERLREVVIRDRALFAANPRPLRTLATDDVALGELSPPQGVSADAVDDRLHAAPRQQAAPHHEAAPHHDDDILDDPSLLELDDEPLEMAAREPAVPHEVARPASAKEAKTKLGASKDGLSKDGLSKDGAAKPVSAKPAGREPIRTRTMARLLAAQGHRGRALSIYDDLLAKNGADASLREEAEALRSQSD